MSLPVPVIASFLQALIQAQQESDRHRLDIELQMYVAKLQQECTQTKIIAQKEIIQQVLTLAQHSFDRKMDFLTNALGNAQTLINNHHQSLLDEQTDLRNRRFDSSLDRDTKIRIESRLSEISITLIELNTLNLRFT